MCVCLCLCVCVSVCVYLPGVDPVLKEGLAGEAREEEVVEEDEGQDDVLVEGVEDDRCVAGREGGEGRGVDEWLGGREGGRGGNEWMGALVVLVSPSSSVRP